MTITTVVAVEALEHTRRADNSSREGKQESQNEMGAFAISRRTALQGGGGLLVSGALFPSSAKMYAAAPLLAAWIRIAPDNRVTLIASQSEMGQGITTTMAAALADELYLSWQDIQIEFSPFDPAYRDPVYNWMFTGNSQGTSSFYAVMRKMGAAAREMLLLAAAKRLRMPVEQLTTANAMVHGGGRSVTFGQLAVDAARLPVPEKPALRAAPVFAGKSLPRWDIPSKVDGSAIYGIDVKRPGMVLAALRRAPRIGAKLVHCDAAAIKRGPGVLAVVEMPDGIVVVARTYWQARNAIDSAQITWSDEGSTIDSGAGLPAIFADKLNSGPFTTHKNVGDVSAGSGKSLEAVYEVPFQAHATMEPMNCTAHVSAHACEIWAPTQGMEITQGVAAQITGLPSAKITIHRTLIGGGFGRRLLADFVKQTLIVAMAVKRPVKLIWSREEDVAHDFYRTGMLHKISGTVDFSGRLVSLTHRVVSPSHMLYVWPREMFKELKDWSEPVPPPESYDVMAVEGVMDIPYDVPNQKVELHRLTLDVPVSVWRTTGHGPNNFALESFIDELAAEAGKDPLAFRRAMLQKDTRALKVLDTLAEKSNWSAPLSGRSRGLALASAFGGLVAGYAELSVDGSKIKLHRIVCVVDCGRTLDPGIAESNILGGIVWGLSGMRTAVTFTKGIPDQSNFDTFDPIHLWETPPCDVHFVESGEKLGGTGELGPVPIHAAIGNAVFAATGKRIRRLPLSREGFAFA